MRIRRTAVYRVLGCAALVISAAGLLIYPRLSVSAASDGLSLCMGVIVPSLFPFFVVSSMAVELGLAEGLGRLMAPVMRRLFNVGGACSAALALGFIGGYPVGARTAIALYEHGECSRGEAERLLSFCNNSGPAFILGVVGASVFSSSRVGLLLYLVHAAASVITGVCFRSYHGSGSGGTRRSTRAPAARKSFAEAFTSSVSGAVTSTLNICGFVIFFTVFIKLLFVSGALDAAARLLAVPLAPFGLDRSDAARLLTGAIELSSGVWSLTEAEGSMGREAAMAAFMLGWAGLSIHCQTLTFLCSSGLSAKTYILGKLVHGLISAALVKIIFLVFPFESEAAAYLAGQVSGLADADTGLILAVSLGCALLLAAIIAVFVRKGAKKYAKRAGKNRGNIL